MMVVLVLVLVSSNALGAEACEAPRLHDLAPLATAAAQDKVVSQTFSKTAEVCAERGPACDQARAECGALLTSIIQKQVVFDEGVWLRDMLLPYQGQQYPLSKVFGAAAIAPRRVMQRRRGHPDGSGPAAAGAGQPARDLVQRIQLVRQVVPGGAPEVPGALVGRRPARSDGQGRGRKARGGGCGCFGGERGRAGTATSGGRGAQTGARDRSPCERGPGDGRGRAGEPGEGAGRGRGEGAPRPAGKARAHQGRARARGGASRSAAQGHRRGAGGEGARRQDEAGQNAARATARRRRSGPQSRPGPGRDEEAGRHRRGGGEPHGRAGERRRGCAGEAGAPRS
jgi:hypothetical protein